MEEQQHNNNNVDQQERPHRRHGILLSLEGQQVLSLLAASQSGMEELPSHVDGTIIEAVNDMAIEFLAKVKKSVVDILFMSKNDGPERQNRERGLTKTIMDKDWHKTEKQIEKAIRFFPNVVVEKYYGYYPIQWMAGYDTEMIYNLMSVSLIPLVIKLRIELQSFNDELRGGLLSPYSTGKWNALQQIICYTTNNNEGNKLRDDCFSTVRNRMRENNYLVTEDIQQYNLVGKLFVQGTGFVSESRLQYLTDMDPVSLSLPCFQTLGNWLPIHWSNSNNNDIQLFNFLFKAGMKYYPENFGFVFGERTLRNNKEKLFLFCTPYRLACKRHGQGTVMKLVMECIQEYICASTSTSTSEINGGSGPLS